MDAKLKTEWVEALRSGKFEQAPFKLKRADGYCCLGVLCEIQGIDWARYDGLTHPPCGYEAGMDYNTQATLSHMNDAGKSFKAIAGYIEKNL